MLIVIDTETSGLHPDISCLWDVGACAVKDGAIISEFETMVLPFPHHFTTEHRAIVQKVSGMEHAALCELWDAPPPSKAASLLTGWWHGLAKEHAFPAFTSFNLPFDRRFLISSPWHLTEHLWGDCVMEKAARAMSVEPWRDGSVRVSLVNACAHFGIPQPTSHRALADARSAALLAIQLGMDQTTAPL